MLLKNTLENVLEWLDGCTKPVHIKKSITNIKIKKHFMSVTQTGGGEWIYIPHCILQDTPYSNL